MIWKRSLLLFLLTITGLDHFATPKDFRVLEAALDFIGASM